MSLKDYYNKAKSIQALANKSAEEIGAEVESVGYHQEDIIREERFIPSVDFSLPRNFARYGSAVDYYKQSLKRIYDYFPYDGSLRERVKWENESTYLDLYLYNNEYPRTNGYALFSPSGWGALADGTTIVDGYGLPSSLEYIYLEGGPHINAGGMTPIDVQFTGSNYYEPSKNRESNLKYDVQNKGVSLEFWLKKDAFDINKTRKEVVFDLWNGITSSADNYGRLRLELTATVDGANPFILTAMSGTKGVFESPIASSGFTTSSLADSKWHHYALTLMSSSTGFKSVFYVDGSPENQATLGTSSINEVTGALRATVGALITSPSASGAPAYAGKLSASLDEFRYWKTERSAKNIGRHWFTQVGGGSNVDPKPFVETTEDVNTTLGVYYKFNEGITGVAATDSIVLDYSGRVTNGAWTGYVDGARSTDSAIVESAAAVREYKDPIIYSFHPEVIALGDKLELTGSEHDVDNNASMYNSIPSWITEADAEGQKQLKYLTQIMSSYFDTLQLQIESVSTLKNVTYPSSSAKPLPFAERLLNSSGLIAPDLFIDADILEKLADRSEDKVYEKSLQDVKNTIYQNIYNNLVYIYKSKGTEKSFRNLIRCFGIDDDLIKLNMYGAGIEYEMENNRRIVSVTDRYVDFNKEDNYTATVFQYQDSNSSTNTTGFIPADTRLTGGYAQTLETQILFPKKPDPAASFYFDTNAISSSLFGVYGTQGSQTDTTWEIDDFVNYQVFTEREDITSDNCRFVLTGSGVGVVPLLRSPLFEEVYDNTHWNLAVRIKPERYPYAAAGPGSGAGVAGADSGNYIIELHGVQYDAGLLRNKFTVSGTIAGPVSQFVTGSKRFFVGANRTNFTGSILNTSDVKVSACRYWLNYLDDAVLEAHAADTQNYGSLQPHFYAFPFDYSAPNGEVLQADTLVFNWEFSNNTGSNASGQFVVADEYSGSAATAASRFDWLGDILCQQNTALGYGFPASTTGSIDKDFVVSSKLQLPENVQSSDMVTVLGAQEQNIFTRNSRPINYFFAFEKSMAQALSVEMINYFATLKDMHTIIGAPVNRYRPEYKGLRVLRERFFQRVSNNEVDFEKFYEFYKWFDSSLTVMLEQLVPASADFSDNVRTIIESHMFERSKYQHKFQNVKKQDPQIEGTAVGAEEQAEMQTSPEGDPQGTGFYSANAVSKRQIGSSQPINFSAWKLIHAPVDGEQDAKSIWWRSRAERGNVVLSSSTGPVNTNKQVYLKAIEKGNKRARQSPFRFGGSGNYTLGGVGFNQNKRVNYVFTATTPFGSVRAGKALNRLVGRGSQVEKLLNTTDVFHPAFKQRLGFQLDPDDARGEVLQRANGNLLVPFSLYSSSVETGYNREVVENYASGTLLTNLHHDLVYNADIPAQGPFTEKFVGGRAYRHVPLNQSDTSTPDTADSRAEGFKIRFAHVAGENGATEISVVSPNYDPNSTVFYDAALPRGDKLRNVGTKRPVNIQNIKMTTASVGTTLSGVLAHGPIGNYQKNYEVVQTAARRKNDPYFRKQTFDFALYPETLATRGRFPLTVQTSEDSYVYKFYRGIAATEAIIDGDNVGWIGQDLEQAWTALSGSGSTFSILFNASDNTLQQGGTVWSATGYGPVGAASQYNGQEQTLLGWGGTDNNDMVRHVFLKSGSNQDGPMLGLSVARGNTLEDMYWLSGPGLIGTEPGWKHLVFSLDNQDKEYGDYLRQQTQRSNKYAAFNGTTTNVDLGAPAVWESLIGGSGASAKAFSVSFWMRPAATFGDTYPRLFSYSINGRQLYLNGATLGSSVLQFQGGAITNRAVGTTTFTAETWYHVVVAFSGGASDPTTLYVNAADDTSATTTTSSPTTITGYNSHIGAANANQQNFTGSMCDYAVYDKCLVQAEVEEIYGGGKRVELTNTSLKNNILQWLLLGADPDDSSSIMNDNSRGPWFLNTALTGAVYNGYPDNNASYPMPTIIDDDLGPGPGVPTDFVTLGDFNPIYISSGSFAVNIAGTGSYYRPGPGSGSAPTGSSTTTVNSINLCGGVCLLNQWYNPGEFTAAQGCPNTAIISVAYWTGSVNTTGSSAWADQLIASGSTITEAGSPGNCPVGSEALAGANVGMVDLTASVEYKVNLASWYNFSDEGMAYITAGKGICWSTEPIPEADVLVTETSVGSEFYFQPLSSSDLAIYGGGTYTKTYSGYNSNCSGVLDYALPDRSGINSNQTVIVNRFAGSGYEVMSRGYLGPAHEEMSVYSALPYHNLSVINYGLSGSASVDPLAAKTITVVDQIGKNRGLNQRATLHSGRFGTDAAYGSVSAFTYDVLPSWHKTNRNALSRLEIKQAGAIGTASTYDNLFVQHQIPRSELQYAWMTASLDKQTTFNPIGLDRPSCISSSVLDMLITSSDIQTGVNTSQYRHLDVIHNWAFFGLDAGSSFAMAEYTSFGVSFAGMNTTVYEPVSSSEHILGFPEMTVDNWDPSATDQELWSRVNYINPFTHQYSLNPSSQGFVIGGLVHTVVPTYPGKAAVLNAIILKRHGPYGWPTWKQIRGGDHPVARTLRKENKVTLVHGPPMISNGPGQGESRALKSNGFTDYIESPVSYARSKPITFAFEDNTDNPDAPINNLSLKVSYGNDLQYFDSHGLNSRLGLTARKSAAEENAFTSVVDFSRNSDLSVVIRTGQKILPTALNEGLAKVRKRENYDISDIWNTVREFRSPATGAINSWGVHTDPSASVWPLDAPLVMAGPNMRFANSSGIGSTMNMPGTGSGAGDLINNYMWFAPRGTSGFGDGSGARGYCSGSTTATYVMPLRVGQRSFQTASYFTANPTDAEYVIITAPQWEAPAQAGIQPYQPYVDYSNLIDRLGRHMTILPEFRISEHVESVVENYGGDFLQKFDNMFSLSGGTPPNSSDSEFFKTYSTTDFLQNFRVVDDNLANQNTATSTIRRQSIELTCDAILQFLPYKGFYPVERTMELSTLFSKSMGGIAKADTQQGDYDINAFKRNVFAPLMAPGILFNTIKAGVAVGNFVICHSQSIAASDIGPPAGYDGAVPYNLYQSPSMMYLESNHSGNIDYLEEYCLGTSPVSCKWGSPSATKPNPGFFPCINVAGSSSAGENMFNGYFMHMIPFEAIRDPERYLNSDNIPNGRIFDSGLYSSSFASLHAGTDVSYGSDQDDLSSEWAGCQNGVAYKGERSPLFKYAVDNFLCETYNFFLGSPSESSLLSADEGAFAPVTKDDYYAMKISLSNRTAISGTHGYTDQQLSDLATNDILKGFGMYSRASAFGPPCILSGTNSSNYGTGSGLGAIRYPSFEHVLPSHFYGSSHATIIFKAPWTGRASLDDIIGNSVVEYSKATQWGDPERDPSVKNKLYSPIIHNYDVADRATIIQQITSSLEVFEKVLSVPEGTNETKSRWLIRPKFETPIQNFYNVDTQRYTQATGTLHPYGSAATAGFQIRGMWHQHGKPLEGGEGSFVSLTDLPQKVSSSTYGLIRPKSLVDVVGFERKETQLGICPFSKKLEEAVVAVPFVVQNGERRFFDIQRQSHEYVSQIALLNKYVFPPTFDFLTNPSVTPFAFYAFEFSMEVSQVDLYNMWQNLPPEAASQFKKSTATIKIKRLVNELLEGNLETSELQWMVFKVKRKAEKDYNIYTRTNLTPETPIVQPSLRTKYSYNWPYDYFSMVELVSVDQTVVYATEDIIPEDDAEDPVPPDLRRFIPAPEDMDLTMTPGTALLEEASEGIVIGAMTAMALPQPSQRPRPRGVLRVPTVRPRANVTQRRRRAQSVRNRRPRPATTRVPRRTQRPPRRTSRAERAQLRQRARQRTTRRRQRRRVAETLRRIFDPLGLFTPRRRRRRRRR